MGRLGDRWRRLRTGQSGTPWRRALAGRVAAAFRRRDGGPRRPGGWRPVLLIALPVVVVTAAALLVLTTVLDTTTAQGRLEWVRTALAVGAGTGAVLTLTLAWRRQWATEYDAAQHRITELYVKAVEQLGAEHAPVRHGALYALERVAQDNPEHRQTIVDVICAYLRAPYTPAPDRPGARRLGGAGRTLRGGPAHRAVALAAARRVPAEPPRPLATDQDRREEREVRLTAQRILTRHLHPGDRPRRPARTFWPSIDLDLSGAHLIALDLAGCRVRTSAFDGATFTGDTSFDRATFTGDTSFNRATFTGEYLSFTQATFTGEAQFDRATFVGEYLQFIETTFTGDAWFGETTFTGNTWFDRATFTGNTMFGRARFTGDTQFSGAKFTDKPAVFHTATFTGDTWFDSATFTEGALFRKARFTGSAYFSWATFAKDVSFDEATFTILAKLARARARPGTTPDSTWPIGWTVHEELVTHDDGVAWWPLVPVPVVLPAVPAGGEHE